MDAHEVIITDAHGVIITDAHESSSWMRMESWVRKRRAGQAFTPNLAQAT